MRTPANSLSSSTWHHAALTYDGTSTAAGTKLYIDGAYQTPTVVVNGLISSILSASDVEIGFSPISGAYFYGKLDDVRVYNRVLSAAEIAALYNSATSTSTEGALMYNSDKGVMQYCNGTNWVRIGSHAP